MPDTIASVHPYFWCRASTMLARTPGFEEADPAPLAEWAEREARAFDRDAPIPGVLVGQDGTLHATIQRRKRHSSTGTALRHRSGWVLLEPLTSIAQESESGREIGMEHAALSAALDRAGLPKGVLRVHYSDVCEGPCTCGQDHKRTGIRKLVTQ